MGTELVGPCVKGDSMDISAIPPGFESLVPFTLKKVQSNQNNGYSGTDVASATQKIKLETGMEIFDNLKPMNPVSRMIGMKCNQIDSTSGDESEADQHMFSRQQLPKGVVRGCEACSGCQKVTAKWHPEEARRPDLVDAPVFYPSEEEFEDTLKYISSIRGEAEAYGICRIVPPPSWKPPSPLKEKDIWERSKFATRVQRIDKLQNRDSVRKMLQVNDNKRRKKRRCMKNGADYAHTNDDYRFPGEVGFNEAEWFGFEPGSDFTLDAFQKYASDFKAQYFRNDNSSSDMGGNNATAEEQWQPSIETIEGEYWRMVEKPTEEIEVLYGADLETGVFGSGFPKNSQQVNSSSDIKYISSGWNLNNFPRLPGSVLSFEGSDISGVLVPWLYIGMCFSSFCWHVEDHHLYSLNYMHWGDPKMWYGVPGSDALKLEVAMRKHLPDLFEEQPDLLHKLVTQLSPSILRQEGVPVYRCVQKPGEFVLTFPRAYHAGFNCGFNCAEAVNVAPVDWLPHGQNAIELYRETGRKTSISHDKLLLGAAREAVRANWEYNLLRKYTVDNLRWKDVCGKDGILSKALKARVDMERARREFLCRSQALKMESSFDAKSERECSVCFFDLHLSAAGCHNCSPEKYACLNHAKNLCSCSWGSKFFLFRYDITELNILVEALEGKLSAVYRWARLDLGLALSSYVSKDKNKPNPGLEISIKSAGPVPKDESSASSSSKEQKDQMNGDIPNPVKCTGSVSTSQKLNPPVVVLALENVKPKDISSKQPSKYRSKVNSLKTSSPEKSASEKPEKNKDVILLSDDEGDTSVQKHYVENETSVKQAGSAHRTIHPDNVGSSTIKSPPRITVIGPSAVVDKKHASNSQCVKVDDHGNAGISSTKCVLRIKRTLDTDQEIAGASLKQKCNEDEKSSHGDSDKKLYDVDLRSTDNVHNISCSSSGSPNNLDRYYRQKGPRIAKVVRRINCNVEPLDFGTVCEGKLWCDTRAIYPKGFKSRVKYIDVVDPINVCFYISEILDAGRDGPLFMVSVEHTPSEVFAHVSAARCWEMVRERVNQEITKQHKLGRPSLPPLQPPGSLDGMEMFGFTSPVIVQAIQSKDQNRVCTDYWKSRPLMQVPQQPVASGGNSSLKSEPVNDHEAGKSNPGVERVLDGLFKKASPDELQTLYSLLYKKNSTDEESLLIQLLNKEIHKPPG